VPMLEAVGSPAAVNPDRRLKRVAAERGWPVLDLRSGGKQ
jgi:phosphoserine phosphatase